ncbi:MAG: hypothetical protein PHS49_03535 [Candidatus Gracilibacteria bacterium]|nr:hypothetical protein [Candidatus Gracilibacteria bacterium]
MSKINSFKSKIRFIIIAILIVILLKIVTYIIEPKTIEIEYGKQMLHLSDNIYILNEYNPSSAVCNDGVTKLVIDGQVKNILDYPKTNSDFIKGCAINIKYVNKNTINLPICYADGGGSGECQLVIMQYNIKKDTWKYIGLNQFPDYMNMILLNNSLEYHVSYDVAIGKFSLLYMYLTKYNFAEEFYSKHFNEQFFTFINYFTTHYDLENKSDIYEIYFDKSSLLNDTEKNIIKNTLYKYENLEQYFLYQNILGRKIFSFHNKKLSEQEIITLAKYQFLLSIKINNINENKYNKEVGFDKEIDLFIQKMIEESKKSDMMFK